MILELLLSNLKLLAESLWRWIARSAVFVLIRCDLDSNRTEVKFVLRYLGSIKTYQSKFVN